MSSFDRDATLERHQIREISLNVARRLHQVLDRNKYIPASVRPEIDASVRVITGIQRVSRPGRRVYFGRDDVPDVLAGLGTSILTTSRGVMTGKAAVKAGVGGEVLCNVW